LHQCKEMRRRWIEPEWRRMVRLSGNRYLHVVPSALRTKPTRGCQLRHEALRERCFGDGRTFYDLVLKRRGE
jgi:hypothetical protein